MRTGVERIPISRGIRRWLLIAILLLVYELPLGARTDDLKCSALADAYLSKHHKEASPFKGTNMVRQCEAVNMGRMARSCQPA